MKPSKQTLLFLSLVSASSAETTHLKPLVVSEKKEVASLTSPTLQADREELAKTPGGTETIDPERYLTGRASTVADTFSMSPGVIAQSRFGSDEARLSIRGSGLQRTFHGRGIRLLQDGVPINLADGGFDMQTIDPLAASHINVWRGSNALSMGSSTLGGAIDYCSMTGLSDPGGSIRLEAGSFDYLRTRLGAGFQEGNLDAYFSLAEQYQQGFRDHAEQHSQRLFGNVGWKVSDQVESRFYITAVNTESELPGNLTKAEMERDPSQADGSFFGAQRYDNERNYQLFRIANKTAVISGDFRVEFIAAYTYKDLDHPITPFVGVIDQLSHDSLLGVVFSHSSEVMGRAHQFKSGFYFTQGYTDAATFANNFGRRGNLTADADQTATNNEGFLEEQLELGYGFTGIAGATASFNRRENEQNLGAATSYDRDYQDFSPKIGLRWDAENYQIFGNLSSSYEPPSFSETNGALTPNKAQTANTIEIGTRGTYNAFRWDTTLYASQIEGEFLALNNAVGTPLGTINAKDTIHQGVELLGEADLLGAAWNDNPENRLLLSGVWTYGDFKFDNDPVYGNNTLAGLPAHVIHGELIWKNRLGYYAGSTVDWVPQGTYIDQANTSRADAYALLGFKFGRRIDSGLSWFVEAKNLTDETYAASTGVIADANGLDTRNFLPGDGRSVFAGLEWKW
jgi:iron complex outermembrane recepter protein